MPLSHRKLANWYYQLSQALTAGFSLAEALQSSEGLPPATRHAMIKALEDGKGMDGILQEASSCLPASDIRFLSAGASTGHLAEICARLATRHQEMGDALAKGILALLYPLLILHLLLFLLPVIGMIDWEKGFEWNSTSYLCQVASGIAPLWFFLLAAVFLVRRRSPIITTLMRWLPGLRQYQRHQSLADLTESLAIFLETGFPTGRSWQTAGTLIDWPPYKRLAQRMATAAEQGLAPGKLLATDSSIPADFRNLYVSGEQSGQLVPMLFHVSDRARKTAQRALLFSTILYPTLILGILCITVVVQIFSVFRGYTQFLENLLQ